MLSCVFLLTGGSDQMNVEGGFLSHLMWVLLQEDLVGHFSVAPPVFRTPFICSPSSQAGAGAPPSTSKSSPTRSPQRLISKRDYWETTWVISCPENFSNPLPSRCLWSGAEEGTTTAKGGGGVRTFLGGRRLFLALMCCRRD